MQETLERPPTPKGPSAGADDPWRLVPPAPTTVAETGLSEAFLRELVLKVLWVHDSPSASEVATATGLHPKVIDELIAAIRKEELCEVDSSASAAIQFHYRLTERGKKAAHEALDRCRYVGPAPVPLKAYSEKVLEQAAAFVRPPLEQIKEAVEHLVLPDELIQIIGQAFFSRRALMIYGPSGNGKSDIVTSVGRCVAGTILIPYSLYGYGQLIKVFDPNVHQAAGSPDGGDDLFTLSSRYDRRWLPCERPVVIVGGNMDERALEMAYDSTQGVYLAALSIVAQGGVLIIDDLGRQRVSPKTILNRWVLMMEQGFDSFSLNSNEVVRLPLDVTLVFSTNLVLHELVDEAYLRRIAYKVAIRNPDRTQLREITRHVCEKHNLPGTEEALDYLMDRLYGDDMPAPRGCFPRDIVTTILDEAEFLGVPPTFDSASIDKACKLYLGDGESWAEVAA